MNIDERYWQVIALDPADDHAHHQTYTVPATTPRLLHQVTAPYQPAHRVIAAERRRCAVGVAVRLVLEPVETSGAPVVLHVWRIRRPAAT